MDTSSSRPLLVWRLFRRVLTGGPVIERYVTTSTLTIDNLPFHDNADDNYLVIIVADGYQQVGFQPVKVSASAPTIVELMFIPKKVRFDFVQCDWDVMKKQLPWIAHGVSDDVGKARYQKLTNESPKRLAALLNIATVMEQVFLSHGQPLDYFVQIKWDDSLAQDRFFAYCDQRLLGEVSVAADQGKFAPEPFPWLLHPDATASWKQVQFGEANLQLTFHGHDTQQIDGIDCIVVEPDIDYYKDPAAHLILEGLPNTFSGNLTDPATVYVLRWIAGQQAGVPEFEPPYTIELA